MLKEKDTTTQSYDVYQINMWKVNFQSLLLSIIFQFALIAFFVSLWDMKSLNVVSILDTKILILIVLAGIMLHELIHGITWAFFAKEGFRSIRFGLTLKYLCFYCKCNSPMKIKHIIGGLATPFIVMGLLPLIIAFINGNGFLFWFGIIFSLAGSGDLILIAKFVRFNPNEIVYPSLSNRQEILIKKMP